MLHLHNLLKILTIVKLTSTSRPYTNKFPLIRLLHFSQQIKPVITMRKNFIINGMPHLSITSYAELSMSSIFTGWYGPFSPWNTFPCHLMRSTMCLTFTIMSTWSLIMTAPSGRRIRCISSRISVMSHLCTRHKLALTIGTSKAKSLTRVCCLIGKSKYRDISLTWSCKYWITHLHESYHKFEDMWRRPRTCD